MDKIKWTKVSRGSQENNTLTMTKSDKGELSDEPDDPSFRIKMNFDEMLEELGELGRFQLVTYILVCLPVIFAGANSLSYVFTAGIPNYRCFIPGCDDPNRPDYSASWVTMAVPRKSYGLAGDDSYIPAQCERFRAAVPVTNHTNCSANIFTEQIEHCARWVSEGDELTIVNDWNIMCFEKQWMISLIGTVHFAGIITGSAFFGVMADKFGRKLVFIICILIMGGSGAIQVFSPEYISFTSLVFINSVGTAGVYPLAFIIGVELVGRKKRETTGIVLNYFYALGEALLALVAYFTRTWKSTQAIVSMPCIIFISYIWLIPESVRWLLVNQKSQRAKYIVVKAAKINKVILSEALLSTFDEDNIDDIHLNETPVPSVWPIIKDMFSSKKIILRFTIVLFIWIINSFVYYGLSLNSTSMSGSKYLNFALVCLVEIPGYTAAWISIKFLGRRISLVGSLILCGVTCMSTIFVPIGIKWLILSLSLIGKLGITSSFSIIYVYTSEMLPTQIRSGGVGASSTTGRIGALVAPFIPLLGVYIQPLPMVLFGTVSIIAALTALKLPETRGIKLPETVEEAKKL